MIDQLKIGNKSSFDDFEASVKERTIHKPKKKSIKQTVPFFNVAYDFSAINGEVYWEERELKYIFEIMADTPALLEGKKARFASWIMNVMNEELHDPFIPNYHFKATFDDIEEEDESNIEKSTITVKFTAYPYMIADVAKVFTTSLVANTEKELTIKNESSHRVTPTIEASVAVVVANGSSSYGISEGTTMDDNFKLEVGATTLKLLSSKAGTITFAFAEEIF